MKNVSSQHRLNLSGRCPSTRIWTEQGLTKSSLKLCCQPEAVKESDSTTTTGTKNLGEILTQASKWFHNNVPPGKSNLKKLISRIMTAQRTNFCKLAIQETSTSLLSSFTPKSSKLALRPTQPSGTKFLSLNF